MTPEEQSTIDQKLREVAEILYNNTPNEELATLTILRLNPKIDILRVGDAGAPTSGTLDPDILIYLQRSQRILLTDNRKSMPEHLEAHWANGGFIWGLFWLKPQATIRELAEDVALIWETTEAEEWKNQLIWIPL